MESSAAIYIAETNLQNTNTTILRTAITWQASHTNTTDFSYSTSPLYSPSRSTSNILKKYSFHNDQHSNN